MKRKRFNRSDAIYLLAIMMLAGCTTPPPPRGRPNLDYLVDGKTTRTMVLQKLGQPAGRFEQDNILTYRLGYEEKSRVYRVVERESHPDGWPTWMRAGYSLVLVFDEQGILSKHSLLEVN